MMKKEHSIQIASRRTGLSPHVIRIWEKRYKAVVPQRTGTNRRRYTDDDIERLQLLKTLTLGGHRIGEVAQLPLEDLQQLKEAVRLHSPSSLQKSEDNDQAPLIEICLKAIDDFDSHTLELSLARASVSLSPLWVIEKVVIPLLKQVGKRWKDGSLRLSHEHFASNILRPFLIGLNRVYDISSQAPGIVTATPLRQFHEFDALISLAAATTSGWRPTWLGTNLPAEEIASVLQKLKSRVIALSLVHPRKDPLLFQELPQLRRLIPSDTYIVATGPAAGSYQEILDTIEAHRVADFAEMTKFLSDLH